MINLHKTMRTELLSPAGDIEAGYAALYYGADAVYLGLPKFSARADATNFSPDELDAFIAYAHSIDRKVYVALNTIVQESELPAVMESLHTCVAMNVDAIIVQDLGIARIVRTTFPELQLHASTQMAIHNLEGALALKKLGFTRVVLARELSLSEIQKIKQDSGLEIEVFIHGALCYSYSGLCTFSSFETARSANRGKCVYSCRALYRTPDKQAHLFSMKDLALEQDILKLDGISLKIEGRKKNALYVAATTNYYRKILDTGKADASLSADIKQIFARPWTKLHFNGKNKDVIDPDFVGHRGIKIGTVEKLFNRTLVFRPERAIAKYDGIQIDIAGIEKPFGFSAENIMQNGRKVFEAEAGKSVEITLPDNHPFIQKGSNVYLASSSRVKGSYTYTKPKPGAFKHRQPIDVTVYVMRDKVMACIQNQMADIGGNFEPAKDVTKTMDAIRTAFDKTGDTPFVLNDLQIENPDHLFVPMSVLNDLRRILYADIIPEKITRNLPAIHLAHNRNAEPKWLLKTDDISNIVDIDLNECDEILITLTPDFNIDSLATLPHDKLRLSLPPIIRQTDRMHTLINTLWQSGYTKFETGNLAGLSFLPADADISFDSFIPVLNSQNIMKCLELGSTRVTLSPEDTLDNIQKLTALTDKACVCLYQDPALFLSANCTRDNACADCSRKELHTPITNGKNRYEMISKNCETIVVPEHPLCWGSYQDQINAASYRIDFCYKKYTPAKAAQIWNTVRAGNDVKGASTFNLKKQFA